MTEHPARVLSDEVMTIDPSSGGCLTIGVMEIFLPGIILAGGCKCLCSCVAGRKACCTSLQNMQRLRDVDEKLHESACQRCIHSRCRWWKTGALMLDLSLDYFFTGSYTAGKIYERFRTRWCLQANWVERIHSMCR